MATTRRGRITETADAAKREMLSDRAAGEKQFELLLEQHPPDRIIYFKRDEAYEVLGEVALALADFQKALSMFPESTRHTSRGAGAAGSDGSPAKALPFDCVRR